MFQLRMPNVNIMFVKGVIVPSSEENTFEKDFMPVDGYGCVTSTNQCYSRGSVTLQSADSTEDPLIDMGILSDERDVPNAIEAVKLARAVFQHEAMAQDVAQVVMPDASVETDEQLEQYVRTFTGSHGYYSGTCKMGSYADSLSVTDKQGRVWGVGKLRAVDSSIIPEATSGPITSVCTMLAEKICDVIEKLEPGNF